MEEDAELALLHQFQAGQDAMAWEDEGSNGATAGELSSNTETKKDVVADDQVLRAMSSSVSAAVPDGAEIVSLSVTIPVPAASTVAGQHESRSSSASSTTRKTRTVGGFIADDSDDEMDNATLSPPKVTSLLQPPASNATKGSVSPSPLQHSVTSSDLQAGSENQGDLKVEPSPHGDAVRLNSSKIEPPAVQTTAAQVPALSPVTAVAKQKNTAMAKTRLPHDIIGKLEDRIKEDPRGALEDGWLPLISEHRKRSKLDDARDVYERFFKVFPQAAEVWSAYLEMELQLDNFLAVEAIFNKALLTVPSVQLWSVYLNYIRRRNDLTNDITGIARTTVSQAYDFVLGTVGIDKDSGKIWQEYIQFIRSAPGQIGGNSWQDQQKMDLMRKAYQRAICVPMSSVNILWKEYDQFEMSLNKMTGRKFLQEKSPSYMSARSANTALENLNRSLSRTTLPRLPPIPGFEGDVEYQQQVELWKKWISWEQEDPLALKGDELTVYNQRVVYVYKQALMALRFWPAAWVDAAEWCFANDLDAEGTNFLADGIAANPESCLIALKQADRIETTLQTEEAGKTIAEKGVIVRAPYDKLLDSLYELAKELNDRKAREQFRLEQEAALDATISTIVSKAEDDEENDADKAKIEAHKSDQLKAIEDSFAAQKQQVQRTISFVWIALMRAMRRIQGNGSAKGPNGAPIAGGSRQVFADARSRGLLTSDVYVAAAQIEHHVYGDKSGPKIFEKGAKLFPMDDTFILEYLRHLISIPDITNARVTFETSVSRLTSKPETVAKAKKLYAFFHKYESKYGTFEQIKKLEKRMAELYPDDAKLSSFAARFTGSGGFDPTAVRPVISPLTQQRPKNIMQSIEQPQLSERPVSPRPVYNQVRDVSPRPQYPPAPTEPKRHLPLDDMENDMNRPRKLARGESPLKGAAGRRLDQQKRLQGTPQYQSSAPPFVVPRDITFLLSIIPKKEAYHADPQLGSIRINPNLMVQLLKRTAIPDFPPRAQAQTSSQGPVHTPQVSSGPAPSYGQNSYGQAQTSNYGPPSYAPPVNNDWNSQGYSAGQNYGNQNGGWPQQQQQQHGYYDQSGGQGYYHQ